MRPIEKPNCPTINGVPKTVSDYKYWKLDLENAIGMFCSYCGMRLNNSPQVEHVVPQNPMTGFGSKSLYKRTRSSKKTHSKGFLSRYTSR